MKEEGEPVGPLGANRTGNSPPDCGAPRTPIDFSPTNRSPRDNGLLYFLSRPISALLPDPISPEARNPIPPPNHPPRPSHSPSVKPPFRVRSLGPNHPPPPRELPSLRSLAGSYAHWPAPSEPSHEGGEPITRDNTSCHVAYSLYRKLDLNLTAGTRRSELQFARSRGGHDWTVARY